MPQTHTVTTNETTRCDCGCTLPASLVIRGDHFARPSCRQRFYRHTVLSARNGDAAALATVTARGWNINANIGGGRSGAQPVTRRTRRAVAAAVASAVRVQRFGVEIEFVGSEAALVAEAAEVGIDIRSESYNHTTRRHWKIVRDGSCGFELVSPVLSGEEGAEQVRKACAALRRAGAHVSVQCGLHVHLDVSDLSADDVKRAVSAYAVNQPAINSILSRSRHANMYATAWNTHELAAIASAATVGQMASAVANRYKTVNLQSFPRYGTIEFRQHQGTHNAEKITRWINFVSAIVSVSRSREIRAAGTFSALVSELNLTSDDAAFFAERAMELA